MRIGALRLRRAALAAAGIAAGTLAGCQSSGSQYAYHGVARGDMAPTRPPSPAWPPVSRYRWPGPAGPAG